MKARNSASSKLSAPIPERLKEARLARGYSISELAELIGVSRQAVSQFELGHAKPSGTTMASLVQVLNFPLSFFSKPLNPNSPSSVTFFRSLKSAAQKMRDMTSVRINWLEEIYLYFQQYLDFPNVNLPSPEEFQIREPLDDDQIENIALFVRKYWGLGQGPISNLTLLLERNGIIISRAYFGDQKIDACSNWKGERPFIFLGSDKESAVRSRFDLAHELGHLLLHLWVEDETLTDKKTFDRIEKEANRFAAAFLLPKDSFAQEVMSTSLDHFIQLKKRWKVSIAAMIYRCEDLGILTENQALYLRKQMAKLKMTKKEPLDDELVPETPNALKQAITMLLDNGVLTVADILDTFRLNIEDIEALCNLSPGTLTSDGKVVPLNFKNKC
ncbi:helix-turn-helix domain-containing protein [Effusibacillus pohliae]|uniref:helix-turn-helix domain-containing protein n=1 Tax=Effusibacillus pohliae TaxID=232270 RepID=UPI00037BD86C|nr:XRE family transcriptional regulator [Effusibacillus pohliae]